MAFVMSLRGGVALRPTTDSHRQPRKASRSSKINLRSSGDFSELVEIWTVNFDAEGAIFVSFTLLKGCEIISELPF